MDISRETLISEVVENCPQAMPAFQAIGMHCMGCPYSQMESLEMGCAAHGTDVTELVEKLNAYLASRE
jgi:hybrid cluster-associated redox disulfide protein